MQAIDQVMLKTDLLLATEDVKNRPSGDGDCPVVLGYSPLHTPPVDKCNICGKRMSALEKMPGIEQCPRCDSIYPMEFRDTILWD